MRKKAKRNQPLSEEKKETSKSKEYTIDELIELGEMRNKIELAAPLYNKKETNKNEQDS